jgi:hypothetical protein
MQVDGVNYDITAVRYHRDRLVALEEEVRAWRNAFEMFSYHPTKHCITRSDFSGEPPEANSK